tara:strand:+ start:354 stop:551 length:198 start_codon:yes stop_codon:yes gene_type:complete
MGFQLKSGNKPSFYKMGAKPTLKVHKAAGVEIVGPAVVETHTTKAESGTVQPGSSPKKKNCYRKR